MDRWISSVTKFVFLHEQDYINVFKVQWVLHIGDSSFLDRMSQIREIWETPLIVVKLDPTSDITDHIVLA